ncbi:MAG: hypothetical protein LBE84_06050 [Planctomycetota bacterium]|jgi:hypothetical protein|nr:hypothetical protein [Planctomycetota bacterium]
MSSSPLSPGFPPVKVPFPRLFLRIIKLVAIQRLLQAAQFSNIPGNDELETGLVPGFVQTPSVQFGY